MAPLRSGRRRRVRRDASRSPAEVGRVREAAAAAAAPVAGDVAGGTGVGAGWPTWAASGRLLAPLRPPSPATWPEGPAADVGRVRKVGGAAAALSPAP
jgi:hypothetical protein